MGTVYIGTCGYDYPEWRGVFYPPSLKREDFLPFYATQYNALELNFTYYQQPDERNIREMMKKTEGKVKFSVKGHQSFTHYVQVGQWRGAVSEFRRGISPLFNEGCLSSVLLQFPQSFFYSRDTRLYLAELTAAFSGVPLAVEFRHNSWQQERVYAGLTERNIAYCMCDMPVKSKLPSFSPVVTGSGAYMRYHGKNAASWYGTNARERYDYAYTEGELLAYKAILADISSKTQVLQIYFNNHAKGAASLNAKAMMAILSEV